MAAVRGALAGGALAGFWLRGSSWHVAAWRPAPALLALHGIVLQSTAYDKLHAACTSAASRTLLCELLCKLSSRARATGTAGQANSILAAVQAGAYTAVY